MKIITMATLKGGAGKTVNLFNIAGILSETNNVLLIDVDPQCNLSNDCRIDVSDRDGYSVKDIFDNTPVRQPAAEELIVKAPIPDLERLDIIPSSILLFKTEQKMASRGDNTHILERYIERNRDTFNSYDYVLIDTNPSMSLVNINAFYAADSIILSTDVSNNGISGAELFCALWDEKREELEKEDNIEALIIGNNDRRSRLGQELFEFASDAGFSRDILLKTVIPQSKKIKDTEMRHSPINILYRSDALTQVYRDIVNELKEGGTL